LEDNKASSADFKNRGGKLSAIDSMSEVRSFTPQEMIDLKIVHAEDEGSSHLKVFRDLRTQLVTRAQGTNFVCLVTSVVSGGGSYVATNLAATDPVVETSEVVYASGVPRLRVVPVGNNKEGGTEKINSERMREFFFEVKSRYPDRYIVVDAPSASDYDAELRILTELCDFVVLVVPYGKATEAQVNAAIEKIGTNRLAGVVYNQL